MILVERGRCPHCHWWLPLRRDGTITGHGAKTLYGTWCAGAMQRPLEVREFPYRPRFTPDDPPAAL